MSQPESVHDYNDYDGIALEAGGEVFIVNRNRLMQDSVAFRDMFVVARKDAASEEGVTPKPIPTGDDAAAFRDFLWALRVRPPAVLAFTKSQNNPEKAVRLINVASLSHKYQDQSLADWALEQLHATLSSSTFVLEATVLNPLLVALARIESGDKNVHASALTRLLRERVDEASRRPPPNSLDPIALVQACTTSGFNALLNTAYHALLIAPGSQPLQWINDPRISLTNKKQLLYGAYRLSEEWDRVLGSCPRHISTQITQCGSARSADLLTKLKAARSTADEFKVRDYYQLEHSHSGPYFVSSSELVAITTWKTQVQNLIDNFPVKLATYFDLADSGL